MSDLFWPVLAYACVTTIVLGYALDLWLIESRRSAAWRSMAVRPAVQARDARGRFVSARKKPLIITAEDIFKAENGFGPMDIPHGAEMDVTSDASGAMTLHEPER